MVTVRVRAGRATIWSMERTRGRLLGGEEGGGGGGGAGEEEDDGGEEGGEGGGGAGGAASGEADAEASSPTLTVTVCVPHSLRGTAPWFLTKCRAVLVTNPEAIRSSRGASLLKGCLPVSRSIRASRGTHASLVPASACRGSGAAAAIPAAAGSAGEGALSYAGFWWRALGFIIDSFVLMVPNMLLAIPYFYLTMTRGKPVDSMESFMMMDGLMVVAYLGSMVGGLLVALTYETWMIAAFGATLGKMAIGVRVGKPGGERLTYGQAFGRYSAKLVTMLVWLAPAYAALFIGMYISFGGGPQEGEEGAAAGNPLGLVVGAAVMLIWFFVGGFGYYMAGWTEKKQTLHDKLAKTVVINKTPV